MRDRRTGRVSVTRDALGPQPLTAGIGRWPKAYTFVLADVTGDGLADLVFRRRGRDDVLVHRTFQTDERTRFHSPRRWGRWPQRLPLRFTYLVSARANLAARDPRGGKIVVALWHARPAPPGR